MARKNVKMIETSFFSPTPFSACNDVPGPPPSYPTEVLDPLRSKVQHNYRSGSLLGAWSAARRKAFVMGKSPSALGSEGIVHTPKAALQAARWTATARDPHQRLARPCTAALRNVAGARCARKATRRCTRRCESSFQRPPISAAGTHKRCGPPREDEIQPTSVVGGNAGAVVFASHCCGTTRPSGPIPSRTTRIHARSRTKPRRASKPVDHPQYNGTAAGAPSPPQRARVRGSGKRIRRRSAR